MERFTVALRQGLDSGGPDRIEPAARAEEGLAAIKADPPDVILTDLIMRRHGAALANPPETSPIHPARVGGNPPPPS